MKLCYPETATFFRVSPDTYGNKKTILDQEEIPVFYGQNSLFSHSNNQDLIDSDGIIFPDPSNAFVIENANRLEGMYVYMNPFNGDPLDAWYKIESVTVSRDMLLTNTIDNVECLLKKTRSLYLVS